MKRWDKQPTHIAQEPFVYPLIIVKISYVFPKRDKQYAPCQSIMSHNLGRDYVAKLIIIHLITKNIDVYILQP